MNIKAIIRKVFKARDTESFKDTLDRHKTSIEKLIYKRKYSLDELSGSIKECGLSSGDTVLVHASWRKFYNLAGSPEDVINVIESIVGEEGTIIMPCYGHDRSFLDVNKTPSTAGVISETFRKMDGVRRSSCTHFSMAAKGANAEYLICDHGRSIYGFDTYSPCYKLTTIPNSKVLFLGLGSTPAKISIFHCAGGKLMTTDEKMRTLISKQYFARLIDENNIEHVKEMVIRQPGHGNNEKVFKKIFRSLRQKYSSRLCNLDIVVIDAKEAYEAALSFAEKGIYCYKNV